MSDVTAATSPYPYQPADQQNQAPQAPAEPDPYRPDPAIVAFDQRLQSLEDRVYRLEHPVQTA